MNRLRFSTASEKEKTCAIISLAVFMLLRKKETEKASPLAPNGTNTNAG